MSRKQRQRKAVMVLASPQVTGLAWYERKRWLAHLVVTVAVVLVYANGLANGFVSDDIGAIVDNPHRVDLIWHLKEYPVSAPLYVSRVLVAKLAGLNPLPYRLVNLLFHLGSANLILLILPAMVGGGIALSATLIFAVHPLLSEAVVWISGMPYSGYTFLGLLSFWLYLRRDRRGYWLSLVCFAAALSFNAVGVAWTLIITVYEALLGSLKRNLFRLTPFWVTGVSFLVFYLSRLSEKKAVDAVLMGGVTPVYNPLTQIPAAIGNYLELFFWPGKLTLYHSETTYSYLGFASLVVVSLAFFGLFVYGLWRDRRLAFFLSWFILAIAPTLTPFGVNWLVAERYVYLGVVGLIVATLLLYRKIVGKLVSSELNLGLLAITIFFLFLRTVFRNMDWKSEANLYRATAKTSPSSPFSHLNLGYVLRGERRYAEAEAEFSLALQINPQIYTVWYHRALNYFLWGKLDLALPAFAKSVELSPTFWQGYQGMVEVYRALGDNKKTIEMAKKAVESRPDLNEPKRYFEEVVNQAR